VSAFSKFTAVILSCLILQSVASPQPSAAQSATMDSEQVLAKMEQAGRNFPFIQAGIVKTSYNSAIGRIKDDPQSGKIWIATPSNASRRIKVEFEKPVRELFLVDKGAFLHYYPGQKTGDRKAVKKDDQAEGECIFFGLCQPGPRIKEFYDVRVVGPETLDGVKTMRLSLKPKDSNHVSGFALIELWLDSAKWYAVQTRVTESNKNYANYRFSNFQTEKIADSVFKIDIAKDAEISDHK
jgi:outer membrane lipoprotein-sorting protein